MTAKYILDMIAARNRKDSKRLKDRRNRLNRMKGHTKK